MVDTLDNITNILTNALSGDKQTRQDSEKKLEQMALGNFPEFLYELAKQLSDESKPVKIRQLAATYIKNSIVRSDSLREIWTNKLDPAVKDQIKRLVLSTLATNYKEVRAAAGIVIAGICKVDLPLQEKWPELISSLCQNSYHENINISLAAIESLGYLCEELTLKTIDTVSIDSILSALITNLASKLTNLDVVKSCLKALFHTIRLAEKNFSREAELKIIMDAIFNAGNAYAQNDEILEKVAMIFIEIAAFSSYYDYITEYVSKIAEFTFYIIKNKSSSNEKLALLAYEFWCSLGDEEVSRLKSESGSSTGISLNLSNSSKKTNRRYFQAYYKQIIEIILANITPKEEDEEDSDTWTYSKASSYLLHVMVQVIDYEMMEQILKYIEIEIISDNLTQIVNSILFFAVCCDTSTHKIRMHDFVNSHIGKIINYLFHQNTVVKSSASLCMVKICKYFGKSGIFDSNTLNTVVPALINALPSKNKIAINICQSLIHIAKAVGDLDTLKNSNPMSIFYEKIFSELVATAFRTGAMDRDSNLTMNCFLLINTLVEYSSHDKQEKLTEILIFFLSQFEGTLSPVATQAIQSLATANTQDTIFLLQSYYCTVFRAVFKKLLKKISKDVAVKIYTLLENSFKQRQTVYDEAILCLGSLAINVGEGFEPIVEKLEVYLLYAIQKIDESSLCKAGIMTLGCVTRSIGHNFYKYSDKFIPVLLEILTNENASRYCKLVAITTIGEICIAVNEHFLKYLDTIMKLFLSAANMAATVADPEDEDTQDYLKDLRFELIEAFTFISFGLDDCNKKNLFVPYVPQIFSFFKIIVDDAFPQRADILKSMLSFISDMASSYGKEIKSICEKEFVRKLLTKLRGFKIKRYEVEINQQEEVLKLVLD